jgi:hypothetical protein
LNQLFIPSSVLGFYVLPVRTGRSRLFAGGAGSDFDFSEIKMGALRRKLTIPPNEESGQPKKRKKWY